MFVKFLSSRFMSPCGGLDRVTPVALARILPVGWNVFGQVLVKFLTSFRQVVFGARVQGGAQLLAIPWPVCRHSLGTFLSVSCQVIVKCLSSFCQVVL